MGKMTQPVPDGSRLGSAGQRGAAGPGTWPVSTELQLPAPPGGQRDRRTPQTMPRVARGAWARAVPGCAEVPASNKPNRSGLLQLRAGGSEGSGRHQKKAGGAGAVEAREPSFHPWAQVPESLPALALIS